MAGQSFRTTPAPNLQAALYQVAIVASAGPLSGLGSLAAYATYTFPLSPQHLRYERSALSSYFDTQGPASKLGVTRVVDTYGLTPPNILVEGTTGWDYHDTDGGIITGLQSVQLLKQFLDTYAQLNQQQRAAGNTQLYQLEFYDFFSGEFWQVEPVGPQVFRQAADRPLLTYYLFRWAGVKSVSAPVLGSADALLAVFGTPAAAAAGTMATTAAAFAAAYLPVGVPDNPITGPLPGFSIV